MNEEQKRVQELKLERIEELQTKLVEEFTPYESWEEFVNEREKYEKGQFKERGR